MSVTPNPSIFREYDIRGVAERDYDAEFAGRLGRAFGTLAAEHGATVLAVGRDCRLTSDAYAAALREGMAAAGVDVLDLGVCPSPLVYFAIAHWQLGGGIQVTGSHNASEYNGFKLCLGTQALHGEQIQDLRARIDRGTARRGAGRITPRAVIPSYQDYVVENVGPLGRPIHVVVDAGNGTGGPVAPELYERLGARVTPLFCDLDGRFPNHHPDPTVVDNMRHLVARVRETGAELGIAFDGDADRIGVVDAAGRMIWGDELLVLYARDVLGRHPGAVVVSEVKCSQRLYDDIARRGGRGIMWKAGHSLLKAKMRETGALVGGEMSGHIFFKERSFGFDDGIYAGARLLEILGRTGTTVDRLLADLPRSETTPELRVDCPDDVKFRVADRVRDRLRAEGRELIDIDGVRVRFPHGWGLLRASNTQPVLVMRFEADSAAHLAEYRASLEAAVSDARRELGCSCARPAGSIVIRGARGHNLKNIDVEIPRERLVVVTGLSGSGKSTLAFDTLYAEGQRRYVESLSAYARQFLEQMEKPDCDAIEGLSPAIAIEQKGVGRSPRSTVGTVTEIADYLRLLFARVGRPACFQCGREIAAQTVQQVVDRLVGLPPDTRLFLYAPVVRDRKGEHRKELDELRRGGFVRVRVDGELRDLADDWTLARTARHTVEVLVDRLVVRPGVERRLADSLEVAFRHGDGAVLVEAGAPSGGTPQALFFSERHACPTCGVSYPEFSPRFFSFNSPHGACPTCGGLGVQRRLDPALVIPEPTKPLPEALARVVLRALPGFDESLAALAAHYGFGRDTPVAALPEATREALLYGSGDEEIVVPRPRRGGAARRRFAGLVPLLERRQRETRTAWLRDEIEALVAEARCPDCEGTRLRREARFVRVGGRSIVEVSALSVRDAQRFLDGLALGPQDTEIARPILKDLHARLGFLIDVGLDYLSPDRGAATLSGGEGQRIWLATQIGSRLTGVLYVLDEPSIGLHQRDNARLLATLLALRDLGNTVVVVEHDPEMILAADHVIDMGPGAGVEGGRVVAVGTPAEIVANPASLTGRYLAGALSIPIPSQRRRGTGWTIAVRGARANNLRGVDVSIPLGTMTCVTGVSGSGKSTLVIDTLYRALARRLGGGRDEPGAHDELVGWQLVDKVIEISQAPIGRSPRSNPATYTGLFGPIRELFAQLPDARARGFGPGRFSFNVKGGRCEACAGDGVIAIEMHFLPDVYVTCEVCGGRRYDRETLEVKWKGLSIADVLDLTVAEAFEVLGNVPAVRARLDVLREVGLEYLRLGQPGTTLSGGEAQRVKLARELARRATGRTLYVLDEPTTGLHFDDVRRLLDVLGRLVDSGNTVLLIEHNLDVVKSADYVIDLGPDGGDAGGRVVAAGTPEDIADCEASHTGRFLRAVLRQKGDPATAGS